MRHQKTVLPTNKHNKKRKSTGKPKLYKTPKNQATNQVKKHYNSRKKHIRCLTAVINVVTPFTHRDSNSLQRSTSAKSATNMVTSQVYATKRRLRCITSSSCRNPEVHQLHVGPMYVHDSSNNSSPEDSSSDESFCLHL